ncbi:DUF4837 family protein [Marivirga arenosa]|uniref:DUF4837 family protein n=1 Tax=Marivirga arenosa TaxID=3059076 RepID=A0AA49GEY0_9BACT|nr:DUF4837 family protein [Marivirga sp. ABR2-2]WKK85286.2 DUF4837 family protein [Marivirga sp. ABR2-2]
MHLLKKLYNLFLIVLLSLFIFSCSNDKKAGEKSENSTMQKARGESGEVILVIPPSLWDGELGNLLREILVSKVEVLPQDEALYDLKPVDPSKFNSVFKASQNLMFVATLDNNKPEGKYMKKYFTENSLNQIEQNPNLFSFNQEDVYARGQEVLYLFGRNEKELIKNIKANRDGIKEFFNDKEAERLISKYKKTAQKGIMNYIEDSLNLELMIPAGFDIAIKQDDFVWLRELGNDEEFNIWIVKMPYTDESIFDPANIKSLRNELGQKYITDEDIPDLYLTSQDEVEFVIDTINLNNNYTLRTRGLWKYSDNSRGGAFVGYLFANEDSGDLYYMEGYLDAPGESKRESMRKLKAIMGTAKFPESIED